MTVLGAVPEAVCPSGQGRVGGRGGREELVEQLTADACLSRSKVPLEQLEQGRNDSGSFEDPAIRATEWHGVGIGRPDQRPEAGCAGEEPNDPEGGRSSTPS